MNDITNYTKSVNTGFSLGGLLVSIFLRVGVPADATQRLWVMCEMPSENFLPSNCTFLSPCCDGTRPDNANQLNHVTSRPTHLYPRVINTRSPPGVYNERSHFSHQSPPPLPRDTPWPFSFLLLLLPLSTFPLPPFPLCSYSPLFLFITSPLFFNATYHLLSIFFNPFLSLFLNPFLSSPLIIL